MKELLFKNYVFHEGLNLTVRRGNRKKLFSLANKVCLKTTDRKTKRKAILGSVISKQFNEISAYEIQFEHDPHCQKYDGLFETMKDLYPDFKAYEEVTLIFFVPTQTFNASE